MLDLFLTLSDDVADDDARNERQGDGHDDSKVDRLAGGDSALKYVHDWERSCVDIELDVRGHIRQKCLVDVLVEVRDAHGRSGIDEDIDLVVVCCLVSFVDLIRTEAERFSIANMLLLINCLVILKIARGSLFVLDRPVAVVVGQLCGKVLWRI